MFQRASLRDRNAAATAIRHAPAHTHETVGKRTLTEDLPSPHAGETCFYTRAIETAKRELRAIRYTAMPAFIRALRTKGATRELEVTRAAIQLRHQLMTANQHVAALEKSMTYTDPMVLYLRHDLSTLVARATKLGAYRGFENLVPQRYEERPQPKKMGGQNKAAVARKRMAQGTRTLAAASAANTTGRGASDAIAIKRAQRKPELAPVQSISRDERRKAF